MPIKNNPNPPKNLNAMSNQFIFYASAVGFKEMLIVYEFPISFKIKYILYETGLDFKVNMNANFY
jgi:hypothetical protein